MADWNQGIIEEFRATGGRVGGGFEGKPLLLLHHKGAKTSTERVTPLMYHQDGEAYYVFASKAGATTNPAWYHNLRAHPSTRIEVGASSLPVTAVEVTGAMRDEIYARHAEEFPQFAEYQDGNPRVIPVIKLS